MLRKKNLLGFLLALSMLAGCITVPAAAAETDVTLDSDVDAPEILNVVVPAEIPIHMDLNGNITIASNLEIENRSDRPVHVEAIRIDGRDDWAVQDFDSDFMDKPVDAHDLAMSLRGDKSRSDGVIPVTAGNWNVQAGSGLNILPEAKLGLQTQSSKRSIAMVTWTIGWGEVQSPDVPVEPGDEIKIMVLPGDHGTCGVTEIQPDDSGRVAEYPEVTPDTGYELDRWVDAVTGETVDGNTVYDKSTAIRPVFSLIPGWIRVPVPDTDHVTFEPADDPEILIDPDGNVQVMPGVKPDPGYVTDGWQDADGNPVTPGVKVDITVNITITVIVRPDGTTPEGPGSGETPEDPDKSVTLPVLPGEHGMADADEIKTGPDGKIPEFPGVTPDEGYKFDHWEDENGNPVDENTVFDQPTGVKPVCKPDPDYRPDLTTEVGILPGEHGSADADKVMTDADGRIPEFPAVTPDDGYTHSGWEKPDGTPVDGNTVFNPGDEIRPVFTKDPNPVVSVLPGENGNAGGVTEVTTDDNHKIPSFPETYPDAGYAFDHWEDQDGNPVDGETVFTQGMGIRPVFRQDGPVTLPILPSENGNTGDVVEVITTSEGTVGAYPTVYPDDGYVLDRWEDENGNPVDATTVFTSSVGIRPVFKATTSVYDTAVSKDNAGEFGWTSGNDLTIPAKWYSAKDNKWYRPTSIPAEGFYWVDVGNVYVPDSVKTFGKEAFRSSHITGFRFPSGLTALPDLCFANTYGSARFDIPSGVKTIGESCFRWTNIETIVLPNTVTSIGKSICENAHGLKSITFSKNAEIPEYACLGCENLTSVTIPSGVDDIGRNAFQSCAGLTFVSIPGSVYSIGKYAFLDCTSLSSVSLGSGIRILDEGVFSGCSNISYLSVPSTISSIGTYAFYKVQKISYGGSASGGPFWGANAHT